ncbi:DUF421 domain-containing protein [Roseomonas sp. BN140053]|uniref:DUF421 domain-containing protein n=1 Tax=Roseomonas sp. BN140053 TaxID=3391898 RepID=UPI0039ED78EE
MTEMILRAALVWLGLLVLLRLSGRRTLGQMSPVDLVVLLLASEMLQPALLGEDNSLTSAFLVIVTLMLLSVLYALVQNRWPRLGRVLEGAPTLLVRDGQPDHAALRRARVSLDDVMASARGSGIAEVAAVRFAVLETDGRISIIPFGPPAEPAAASPQPPR